MENEPGILDVEIPNDQNYCCGWCGINLSEPGLTHPYFKRCEYCSFTCLESAYKRYAGKYVAKRLLMKKIMKLPGDRVDEFLENLNSDLEMSTKGKYVEIVVIVKE